MSTDKKSPNRAGNVLYKLFTIDQVNLFGYREVPIDHNCEKIDVLLIGNKFVNWLCKVEIPNEEFSESNLYKSI